MSQPNLWFLPRAFFPHGGHGGGELPVFPAPSLSKRASYQQSSGANAPREGGLMSLHVLVKTSVSPRHCERSEAIQSPGRDSGLLWRKGASQ